jgi:hypothetical protein
MTAATEPERDGLHGRDCLVSSTPRELEHRSTASVEGRRSRAKVAATVRAACAREPGLVAVGVTGVVVASVCVVAVAVRGRYVPPEGKLLDAATFDFGVGVFTLTVALLVPLAGFTPPARRRWRRIYYVFPVYGLTLESLQALRGLDPRFTEAGGHIDVIAGIVFGFTAALNTVMFMVLGLRFFRSDVLADRPALRLGIRYGAAAVTLSFAVGILMSVNSGREFGQEGNLLVSHGLGAHGLQAIPMVALLVVVTGTTPRATRWLHAAGIGWLAACAVALAQALLGHAPLERSVLTTPVVVGLALWAAGASHTLLTWRQATHRTPTASTPRMSGPPQIGPLPPSR